MPQIKIKEFDEILKEIEDLIDHGITVSVKPITDGVDGLLNEDCEEKE